MILWRLKKAVLGVILGGIAAGIGERLNASFVLQMEKLTGISPVVWVLIFMICCAALLISAVLNSYANPIWYAPMCFYMILQAGRAIEATGTLTPAAVIYSGSMLYLALDCALELILWRKKQLKIFP